MRGPPRKVVYERLGAAVSDQIVIAKKYWAGWIMFNCVKSCSRPKSLSKSQRIRVAAARKHTLQSTWCIRLCDNPDCFQYRLPNYVFDGFWIRGGLVPRPLSNGSTECSGLDHVTDIVRSAIRGRASIRLSRPIGLFLWPYAGNVKTPALLCPKEIGDALREFAQLTRSASLYSRKLFGSDPCSG